jgi:hypothetical protein
VLFVKKQGNFEGREEIYSLRLLVAFENGVTSNEALSY